MAKGISARGDWQDLFKAAGCVFRVNRRWILSHQFCTPSYRLRGVSGRYGRAALAVVLILRDCGLTYREMAEIAYRHPRDLCRTYKRACALLLEDADFHRQVERLNDLWLGSDYGHVGN